MRYQKKRGRTQTLHCGAFSSHGALIIQSLPLYCFSYIFQRRSSNASQAEGRGSVPAIRCLHFDLRKAFDTSTFPTRPSKSDQSVLANSLFIERGMSGWVGADVRGIQRWGEKEKKKRKRCSLCGIGSRQSDFTALPVHVNVPSPIPRDGTGTTIRLSLASRKWEEVVGRVVGGRGGVERRRCHSCKSHTGLFL